MKPTLQPVFLVGLCCALLVAGNRVQGDATDAIQPGAVWQDDEGRSLTILERNGGTYRGRFTKGSLFDREVTGPVSGDKISWFARDVHPAKGGVGGDNFGTIKGNSIQFKFTGANGKISPIGYTLTRVSPPKGGDAAQSVVPQSPAVATPEPTFSVDPNQPLLEAFSQLAPNAEAWVLAPLDESVPRNVRQNLTYLREDLLDEYKRKARASADAYKVAYQLCAAMISALDERDQTLVRAGFRAAQADTTTGISGDQALSARRNYMMNWPQYAREESQRAELKSEAMNNAQILKELPKVEWSNRTAVLRKTLDALYGQYREALRQSPAAK